MPVHPHIAKFLYKNFLRTASRLGPDAQGFAISFEELLASDGVKTARVMMDTPETQPNPRKFNPGAGNRASTRR